MIAITYFPRLTGPQGQRHACTWDALCRWLSTPVVCPVKYDAPGFSIATYKGDRRAKANVELVYAVGLDFDHDVKIPILSQRFAALRAFVHTTWSSTRDDPRARAFLALSRPVTGEEYERVWVACARVAGITADPAARDPSRFWFRPSIASLDRPYVHWRCHGEPVDVDAALVAVPLPTPPPIPTPRPPLAKCRGPSPTERARAYLARCEPAIQGSGGDRQTFMTAQRIVRGFALSVDEAYALLANDWNPRCVPPWKPPELLRKVEQAARHGRFAEGDLLDRERTR